MLNLREKEVIAQEEDTQKDKYLTFLVGTEYFGIEISQVEEIIGIQDITHIPELPGYIKGVINLRGKIVPVMDVRIRFKKEPLKYNDRTCIIIVDIRGIEIGLIVDSVSEVLLIKQDDIVPPPELYSTSNRYIRGIGKVNSEVKLILDCDMLLTEEVSEITDKIDQNKERIL